MYVSTYVLSAMCVCVCVCVCVRVCVVCVVCVCGLCVHRYSISVVYVCVLL